jgi:hypothetical protein
MGRMRTQPFSWMTDDSNRRFVHSIHESKVRETLKRMGGGWWRWALMVSQSGMEMPQGHNYSMANQVVQPYLLVRARYLMNGEVYWYRSTRTREIFKFVLIIEELS